MKIKMLTPMEGANFSRQKGQELEVGVEITVREAKRLIKAEFAERVPDTAPTETAAAVMAGVENAAARVLQGGADLAGKLAAAAKGKAVSDKS